MNLFFIAWQNIRHRPTSVLLSLILFALGIGLVSFLLQTDRQVQQKFENNLAGVDLVVGAKGSPLQLILSNMYHIDAPTGNISLKSARPFLRPGHPLIELAVPLSLGDSYKGFRIVGSTHDILTLYNVTEIPDRLWETDFEVSLGRAVAEKLNLKEGDRFQSSHGFTDDFHSHDKELLVVSILPPTSTVLDQLILTTPGTCWHMHSDHEENVVPSEDTSDHQTAHENRGSNGHQHDHKEAHETEGHEHTHSKSKHSSESAKISAHNDASNENSAEQDLISSKAQPPTQASVSYLLSQSDKSDITAMLLRFKGRNFQALNLGRNINENTDLQAASPAIEINRLFSLLDSATAAIKALAWAIVFVSAISIFLALYNKLRTRKFELAYMRVKGASRKQVFFLITIEGLMIAFIGILIGFGLSYIGLFALSSNLESNYNYSLSTLQLTQTELWVALAGLGIGFLASLIPSIQASRTNISLILNEGNRNS